MRKGLWIIAGIIGMAAGVQGAPPATPAWKLEPGVKTRGGKPDSWELDLRGRSPAEARVAAAKLSTRLYGPANGKLHQPLLIRTDFASPKVLGIGLEAVSSGGSDLVVKTNGVLAGQGSWPRAAKTHALHRLLYVPLAPGTNTVSLEVTQPSGVVVIGSYVLADSVAALPPEPPPLPVESMLSATAAGPAPRFQEVPMTGGKLEREDGYRGIWYYNEATRDEYKYKYSGGYATYPQQHAPIAIYCKEVDKTFFVYGGTTARSATDPQELLHMVSYYDHKTHQVPRPCLLLNKHTIDAHDNPTLQVDDQGYLWVFSSAHGTGRPSFIHRSTRPWSIDEFQRILISNFSYTQPWYFPGEGFLFLHTRYGGGKALGINATRCLFCMTSKDGREWDEPKLLAGIEAGDYQVSWFTGRRLGTAFDFHPSPGGLNFRANVYYLETADHGRTWRTAGGQPVQLPLTTTNNLALACDTRAEGRLAYLKDVNFDRDGHPIILFLTSKGHEPGPQNGPRQWQTLRWTGKDWVRRPFTTSGNNYDHGSLYIEPDGTWRIIAPTEPGPEPYNVGGEMVLWTSPDEGQSWTRVKQLTRQSSRNHTYARRPVNAHPDFYAVWADGQTRQASESNLFFTDQQGSHVWRLPSKMDGEFATPVIVGE